MKISDYRNAVTRLNDFVSWRISERRRVDRRLFDMSTYQQGYTEKFNNVLKEYLANSNNRIGDNNVSVLMLKLDTIRINYALEVRKYLERVGLKINTNK